MTLFKHSSLKDIASIIQDKSGTTDTQLEPLMLLNRENEQKLFCFPANIGFGIVYTDLASFFTDWAFYSFDFIQENDRLDQYVNDMVSTQPNGPFRLFGYSAGADLAAAVAAKLIQMGHDVASLIFLDPRLIKKEENKGLDYQASEVGNYLSKVEEAVSLLGIQFMRSQILKKVEDYSQWLYKNKLPKGCLKDIDIHIITAEDNEGIEAEAFAWEQLTTKPPVLHQGFGKHIQMLHVGCIENNVNVIKEILSL
jgi:thioesterase domain-containing protein